MCVPPKKEHTMIVIDTNSPRQAEILPADFAETVTPWFPADKHTVIGAARVIELAIYKAQQLININAYGGCV
jgi:hypothetical protein